MHTQHTNRLVTVALLALLLGGCGTFDKIKNIGRVPEMQPMAEPEIQSEGPSLVRPAQHTEPQRRTPNSLWRTGAGAFFRDPRAATVGDIITVLIDIEDEAAVENTTVRTRSNSESSNITNIFGLEGKLAKILPDAFDPTSLTDFGSTTNNQGSGTVDRSERISLTIAALVTNVLPNGNLIIQGRQEVRVNFEVRELTIAGIIRPEDITRENTINHTQIAEARISYGGRGQLTELQQARWGQQLYEILFPF